MVPWLAGSSDVLVCAVRRRAGVDRWTQGGLLVGPQGKPCEEPDLMRVLQKKAHPLNPDFLMYVKSEYFTRVGHNPSAGFVATLLLLHSCRSVHMYGFHIMAGERAHPLFP